MKREQVMMATFAAEFAAAVVATFVWLFAAVVAEFASILLSSMRTASC